MEYVSRKRNRLEKYDYTTPGAYFVTLCVQNKVHLFNIDVGDDLCVVPSPANRVLHKWIRETERKFRVDIDKYVIMPNHVHMLVIIKDQCEGVSLDGVMRWFKTMTTNEYIKGVKAGIFHPFDKKLWQRSYHEHVVRGDMDYQDIWEYIDNNPIKWEMNSRDDT